MKVLIGADVGGTKIAIRVAAADGSTHSDAEYPADGWDASPVDDAARWLLDRLLRAAPGGGEIAAVGIGAQGCDTQEHCTKLAAAIEAHGVPATVVNDAALLIPAAGLAGGIGVIAGTGSIGVGADRAGAVLFAGGWGWVLGDEASAPGIVREATRAALADYDEGGADDGLLSALLAHFAVPDPPSLARAVNDEPTPENWGPAAPAVFRAADEGSPLARGVINEAAHSLQVLVTRLVERGAVGETVVAAGSVIVHQPRLADRFRAYLARAHPGLELRVLDVPPVAGAISLARDRAR
ncbi:N-acetylglucosamine kinase, partial [Actinospica sp.]|uniref:N-acetylglucosamine kinase n=1 Tax=Actinospica sp. TaxID=1872142 RepID=UPI002B804642